MASSGRVALQREPLVQIPLHLYELTLVRTTCEVLMKTQEITLCSVALRSTQCLEGQDVDLAPNAACRQREPSSGILAVLLPRLLDQAFRPVIVFLPCQYPGAESIGVRTVGIVLLRASLVLFGGTVQRACLLRYRASRHPEATPLLRGGFPTARNPRVEVLQPSPSTLSCD